jgi:hypothetical protein
MGERPTTEVTTPSGHKLVLKTYVTGREMLAITDQKNLPESQQLQKLASTVIVSLDDTSEDIETRLLDMPVTEFTEVITEINKIANPTTPQN